MRTTLLAGLLVIVAVLAVVAGPASAKAAPDLSPCPPGTSKGTAERQRDTPLPVPAALRGIVRSRTDTMAIATLSGRTFCLDIGWMETADPPVLTADGRFLHFGWLGYESYGHKLIDRTGMGSEVDTGEPPVWSPSGRLIAAVDYSESANGALNAFAVWEVRPVGLRQVAVIDTLPDGFTVWRIDGWRGEACIALSAVTMAESALDNPRRRAFAARAKGGWTVRPGRCS